eukprot:6485808-Amphidinium_carterae.1
MKQTSWLSSKEENMILAQLQGEYPQAEVEDNATAGVMEEDEIIEVDAQEVDEFDSDDEGGPPET